MSRKESLTSIRMLCKDVKHLHLANANISCKGSKDAMAQWLYQHLSPHLGCYLYMWQSHVEIEGYSVM